MKTAMTIFGVLLGSMITNQNARAELVGYWNFDEGEGTMAFDFTDHENDGTLKAISGGSVPTWIPGHTGEAEDFALEFSQGNVEVPDAESLHITNSFTLAAWMFGTGSNYGHLFVAGDGGANGRNWLLQTSNFGGDSAYFWSATNSGFQHTLNFVPAQNAWHHIAVTYDGSIMTTYYDGAMVSSNLFTASLTAWGTLRLGGFSLFGSGFESRLDEMVIFNTVEDVATIMDGAHDEMTGDPPPPVEPIDPFYINEFTLVGDVITLTWDSEDDEEFLVGISTDVIHWPESIDDSVDADIGLETTRTYDLSDLGIDLENLKRVFFRVEKKAQLNP